ncbi:MAG: GNAT family N-acetyltransferase [Clostridia bacterium]|nr:GNAT family N-acetyltransferase [Clostridia bacterium]
MTTIRRAEPRDIPAVLRLLQQVNLVHHQGRPDLFRLATKYGAEDLSAIFSNDDAPVFVYDEDGAILGHAFCQIQTVQNDRLLCDRKTLYVDDICVDEAARSRGVGKALYTHVREYARSLGCYNLTLNVWSCNPNALHFYERMGLVPQKVGMEQIL